MTEPVQTEQTQARTKPAELDQVLIDAQLEDVCSSAEFLEMEKSAEFAAPRDSAKKQDPAEEPQNVHSTEPELLLKHLDDSNLMDYVAEDDLWKEQLTIEDEPG